MALQIQTVLATTVSLLLTVQAQSSTDLRANSPRQYYPKDVLEWSGDSLLQKKYPVSRSEHDGSKNEFGNSDSSNKTKWDIHLLDAVGRSANNGGLKSMLQGSLRQRRGKSFSRTLRNSYSRGLEDVRREENLMALGNILNQKRNLGYNGGNDGFHSGPLQNNLGQGGVDGSRSFHSYGEAPSQARRMDGGSNPYDSRFNSLRPNMAYNFLEGQRQKHKTLVDIMGDIKASGMRRDYSSISSNPSSAVPVLTNLSSTAQPNSQSERGYQRTVSTEPSSSSKNPQTSSDKQTNLENSQRNDIKSNQNLLSNLIMPLQNVLNALITNRSPNSTATIPPNQVHRKRKASTVEREHPKRKSTTIRKSVKKHPRSFLKKLSKRMKSPWYDRGQDMTEDRRSTTAVGIANVDSVPFEREIDRRAFQPVQFVSNGSMVSGMFKECDEFDTGCAVERAIDDNSDNSSKLSNPSVLCLLIFDGILMIAIIGLGVVLVIPRRQGESKKKKMLKYSSLEKKLLNTNIDEFIDNQCRGPGSQFPSNPGGRRVKKGGDSKSSLAAVMQQAAYNVQASDGRKHQPPPTWNTSMVDSSIPRCFHPPKS